MAMNTDYTYSLISALHPQQRGELKAAFQFLDMDNDGNISKKELYRLMKIFGYSPTERELKTMIERVDLNGEGKIEYDDFAYMMINQLSDQSTTESDLKKVFEIFDKDGDGKLDGVELRHIIMTLNNFIPLEEAEDIVDKCNPNGDGSLDFTQFSSVTLASIMPKIDNTEAVIRSKPKSTFVPKAQKQNRSNVKNTTRRQTVEPKKSTHSTDKEKTTKPDKTEQVDKMKKKAIAKGKQIFNKEEADEVTNDVTTQMKNK